VKYCLRINNYKLHHKKFTHHWTLCSLRHQHLFKHTTIKHNDLFLVRTTEGSTQVIPVFHLTRSLSSCIHLTLSKQSSLRFTFILLSYLLSLQTVFVSAIQSSYLLLVLVSTVFLGLDGASSQTRGGVCLSEWTPHLLHRYCAFFEHTDLFFSPEKGFCRTSFILHPNIFSTFYYNTCNESFSSVKSSRFVLTKPLLLWARILWLC
jgi:hypothetical protein